MTGFPARYAGFCLECEQRIEPGDRITMEGGRVRHVLCPDGQPGYVGKAEVVCPRCFLTACDCDD